MNLQLALAILTASIIGLNAQSVTYTNLVLTGPGTNTLTVRPNQVAKIVTAKLPDDYYVDLIVQGASFWYFSGRFGGAAPVYDGTPGAPTIAGPAEIRLTKTITNYSQAAFITVEIRNTDQQFQPSNAVVIPADAAGPVEIILESSQDLIGWAPALPGTYGASTTNRFFRVRAVRK